MVDEQVIKAFQMMWGKFPEGVMLVDKGRNIIAVNTVYEATGLKAGMVCAQLGSPENHKGCLANLALSEQTAKYTKTNMGDKEVIGFWVPVVGEKDLYLHFSVGMVVDYDNVECNNCPETSSIEGSS